MKLTLTSISLNPEDLACMELSKHFQSLVSSTPGSVFVIGIGEGIGTAGLERG